MVLSIVPGAVWCYTLYVSNMPSMPGFYRIKHECSTYSILLKVAMQRQMTVANIAFSCEELNEVLSSFNHKKDYLFIGFT